MFLLAFDACPFSYSLCKLFTGLANAAFNACKLTVKKAIITINPPAAANIHQLMFILYT
jgi:hypothetical protein